MPPTDCKMLQIDSLVVEIASVDRRSTSSGDDDLNHQQLMDPVITSYQDGSAAKSVMRGV